MNGNTFRYNSTGQVTNDLSAWQSILDEAQEHVPGDDHSWIVPAGPGLVEDFTSEAGWRLVAGSPARGRAVSLPPTVDPVMEDIDGDPRPLSGGDVGADQFSGIRLNGGQEINLRAGWNLVSLSVEPASDEIKTVLGDALSDIRLVKDGAGRLYDPERGVDEIGNWDVRQAYMVYARVETAFSVEGAPVLPNFSIALEAGWNLIPFPEVDPRPIDEVLASIRSAVVLMKDERGGIYHPEHSVDTIEEMRSGSGYLLFVNKATTLTFL